MNRRAFITASLAALLAPAGGWAAGRFDRRLLWRVTRKGLAASHVYGIIHVAAARRIRRSWTSELCTTGTW
ncbi:MAG TPA: hypothetical protein VHG88_04470 [Burkholderiales bacterium]|nr:hypothetical protein [Burkholderiales bacterium]